MTLERHPIDQLAEEFVSRWRGGEQLSVASYAGDHPEYADAIRRLFPTLIAIERFRSPPPDSAPRDQNMPERIGDCRVVREIGRGGMGVVYEALQGDRRVAVKVLPSWSIANTKHLRRFLRESRNTAKLHHPNIVCVYGAGSEKDIPYFIMQYIPGLGLDEVLTALRNRLMSEDNPTAATRSASQQALANQSTPDLLEVILRGWVCDSMPSPPQPARISWRSVAQVGIQVADALHYAHELGIIHRDIKPGNLLIDRDGVPWVTDFGLAKTLSASGSHSGSDIVGTMRYMAPEQFRGECDPRCDVYSLGVTLYEMLTLHPAYDESSAAGMVEAIANTTPRPPGLVQPGLPAELEAIVMKATAHAPPRRHSSARMLANELRQFLDSFQC